MDATYRRHGPILPRATESDDQDCAEEYLAFLLLREDRDMDCKASDQTHLQLPVSSVNAA